MNCPHCNKPIPTAGTAAKAIAAFAKQLTEGPGWTACHYCVFGRFDQEKDGTLVTPIRVNCTKGDPCNIRQTANLPVGPIQEANL